jgi:hypothetical protein
MSILADELSVWDICFRWAGYDPRKFYFRIPLEVENNFRTIMQEILDAHLYCESITLEKREFTKENVKESIYYWLDEMYACIHGVRFNRKLFKWAVITRYDFMQWCQRMNAPLPEFWFPQGWNLQYELPENDYYPGLMHDLKYWPEEERKAFFGNRDKSDPVRADLKSRHNQEARIASRLVAANIWKLDSDRSIASVIRDDVIQKLCGANRYDEDTIREWIKDIAPPEVRARRGRPRKNTDESK